MAKNTWGIGEWFGHPIESLTPQQKQKFAKVATSKQKNTTYLCPFKTTPTEEFYCNKKGGVCSIRPYNEKQTAVLGIAEHKPATVCPARFLEKVQTPSGASDIFKEIAQEVFGPNCQYTVVSEVGFLYSLDKNGTPQKDRLPAGRIDWVIIEGDGTEKNLNWVAIETQAVYFSGDSMAETFNKYRSSGNLPAAGDQVTRRPDWRSSSAKRLAPQLEAKSRRFSRWGNKVVVVIDEGFWENMVEVKNPPSDIENADIVWAIVGYDANSNLRVKKFVLSELDNAVQSLQATEPMPRATFEKALSTKAAAARTREP